MQIECNSVFFFSSIEKRITSRDDSENFSFRAFSLPEFAVKTLKFFFRSFSFVFCFLFCFLFVVYLFSGSRDGAVMRAPGVTCGLS